MTVQRANELIEEARRIVAKAPAIFREALGARGEALSPAARMNRLETKLVLAHDEIEGIQARARRFIAGERPETQRRFRDETSAAHAALDAAATDLLVAHAEQAPVTVNLEPADAEL